MLLASFEIRLLLFTSTENKNILGTNLLSLFQYKKVALELYCSNKKKTCIPIYIEKNKIRSCPFCLYRNIQKKENKKRVQVII